MFNFGPGELVLVFAVFAAVCGWIAHSKGLPAGRYALLGAFLPGIGLILAILAPPAPDRHSYR